MAIVYLVQHAEKERAPGDPGLTALGQRQATRTGRWLNDQGIAALWTSPLRRARETADRIAAVTGLAVRPDDRLRERLNWDGDQPFEDFLTLWARTTHDRDLVPPAGESSRQAAARLQDFLAALSAQPTPVAPRAQPTPVAAVTHGGITVELLRNLLGDNALPPPILSAGIPSCAITTIDTCAITTIDGPTPLTIASVSHLTPTP